MNLFDFESTDNSSSSGNNPDYGPGCVLLLVVALAVKGISWALTVLSGYGEMDFPYSWIAAWYYFLAQIVWAGGKLCCYLLVWPFCCRYTPYVHLDCVLAIVLFLIQLFGLWLIWDLMQDLDVKIRLPRWAVLLLCIALIGPAIAAAILKAIEFLLA